MNSKREKGGNSNSTADTIKFNVQRTKPFALLIEDEKENHPQLEESDLKWLEPRLAIAPDKMGDRVPGLKVSLPVYKTRLKDSCCGFSARGGWRIYYAVSVASNSVYMLFLYHKKVIENPANNFLQQKIGKAFEAGV